jgi:excisionase family DNA binding protein
MEGYVMEYYTIGQVAEKFGVSEETVRRWIRSEKIKAEYLGGANGYKISAEAIEEFIKENPKWAWVSVGTEAMRGAGTALGAALGSIKSSIPVVGALVDATLKYVSSSLPKHSNDRLKHRFELMERKFMLQKEQILLESRLKEVNLELEMVEQLLQEINEVSSESDDQKDDNS